MSEKDSPSADQCRGATTDPSGTTAEDSSGKVEVPAWLAALAETARRRMAQRQADRAEFAERRAHGLRARKRAKLRRAGDDDGG